MGRDLQKKKRRSKRQAIKQPSSNRSKRLLNPLGNSTIARNWNKDETTMQNYRRLGIMNRLKTPTGGVEPNVRAVTAAASLKDKSATKPSNPFGIESSSAAVVKEARVERDADGRIVRVLDQGGAAVFNPLHDHLNALDSSDDSDAEEGEAEGEKSGARRTDQHAGDWEEWGGFDDEKEQSGKAGDALTNSNAIVRQLEKAARRPMVKRPRGLSHRERDWLEEMVDRYGEDTKAMARDRRLNPMQQTEADIRKRLDKWRAGL